MADDRYIGNVNAVTRLPVDRFGLNLSGPISSCTDMSGVVRLPG